MGPAKPTCIKGRPILLSMIKSKMFGVRIIAYPSSWVGAVACRQSTITRQQDSIPISDDIWKSIVNAAASVGIQA